MAASRESAADSGPREFSEIYRAEVPGDQSHWHYNVDREVKLDRPASAVFVRYMGDPALNNIRLYAHCLDDSPRRTDAPIMITHRWTENGIAKSERTTVRGPAEYDVVVGGQPVNESIELAVPRSARSR